VIPQERERERRVVERVRRDWDVNLDLLGEERGREIEGLEKRRDKDEMR